MTRQEQYTDPMVRCAISDCRHLSSDRARARALLLNLARDWAIAGVELIQLREKDLAAGELLALAQELLQVVRAAGSGSTSLVINGRADVAVAAGADGVHLTGDRDELAPAQVRGLFAHAGLPAPTVTVSCHSMDDVLRATERGADYILFGPVFEKWSGGERLSGGTGLDRLREACAVAGSIPVFALGGVTEENAGMCLEAGAAGIAAIRLFAGVAMAKGRPGESA